MARPVVAFYAPMKAPNHPTPSGDRRIARLMLQALDRAGFAPRTVSALRVLDTQGCAARQAELARHADEETAGLLTAFREGAGQPAKDGARPALWFTYHCHYRAPDLLGPRIARALCIPYAISEPSVSPRRREGAWADFARASEEAIANADRLFWTTARDRPGLEEAGHGRRMVHLPAFLDEGTAPLPRPAGEPPHLLTIAMMREGDKLESYRRLAAALAHLPGEWRLSIVGDGVARDAVRAAMAPVAERICWHGALDDAEAIGRLYAAADVFVWPGVGEGVGMVYVEAQAAGLPVVAEDHPAQRDLVEGPLVPPEDAVAFACAIEAALADRIARGVAARRRIEACHGLEAAAAILRRELGALIR